LSQNNPVGHFEHLMDELRAQVTLLERDDLTLTDALSAYEKSVELANECHRLLDEAELRIVKVDQTSRALNESTPLYRAAEFDAASLLLGDDEEDLRDLLDDE
jgi:exodeoxyribonuclease VII small subunit